MSILDRFNARADDLDAAADALVGTGLVHRSTPVHEAAVDVLTRLMSLGNELADDETPLQLRVMMRTLAGLRPMLLEMFAKVDAGQVVTFMTALRDDIQTVIDAGAPPAPDAAPAPLFEDVPLPITVDEVTPADDEHAAS